ncbi:MAG: diaminopimelate decarboxylase, partial [Clostridia bacterium]|nr:diaminopimelate decarboxylase [Clostridia bacterium]
MKTLPFTKEQLEAITSVHPTPFHIYDQAGITRTVRDLQAAFAWNEGFKEYFAVKALPNLAIVQLLRSLGCGADCASSPELMLSEAAGMFGSDIMFSSNDTPLCEFAHAASLDAIINLDDIRHIELLDQLPGFPKTVCCRYNPGGDFSMTNDIMGHLYDTKFGMTRAQILKVMTVLKSKGVERFGIHAMVASATLDGTYYPRLAENMFALALEIREKTGIEISFLNLSG